ncbi:MAG: hypothetical protein IPJ74_18510 [Saprospiraceae bacterium]|nr:hypothetical protein [Saprospiraceae bacterium]
MIPRKGPQKISVFSIRLLTFGLFIVLWNACKNESSQGFPSRSIGHQFIFLDSTKASLSILDDDAEGFFERVSKLDMSIQMQRNYSKEISRDSILYDYRYFLKRDVQDFSESEQEILEKILLEIEGLCESLSPDIFPRKLELIKTKGKHYGNGVYYTRENRIIIPANELEKPNTVALREVLTHEVFHIYSRQHPEKRRELYALIGFQELNDVLILPSAIDSRLLLNPDGVEIDWAIRLAIGNQDTISTIPIIIANAPAYLPERESYFEYIDFNLYPVVQDVNGFQIVLDSLGHSPLHINELPDFQRQIGDNTFYIIHPDEILADNFKWLILAQTKEKEYALERFSENGQLLLKKIEQVLRSK